jgi:hypothetical protein
VLTLDADQIRLVGIQSTQLTHDNFVFHNQIT